MLSLPPALREQIENAAAKDVLGPLRAEEKIRVIRVVERQASSKLSCQESKRLIQARLLESRRQAAVDAWYDRAKRWAQILYP
jgi:hypothetical protein